MKRRRRRHLRSTTHKKKIKPDEDREEREHEVIDILMERAKQNYTEKCNHKFEKFRKEGFARINARKKKPHTNDLKRFLKD